MATWTTADPASAVAVQSVGVARKVLFDAGHNPRFFAGGAGRWTTNCQACGAPAILTTMGEGYKLTGLMLEVGCDRAAVREIARRHATEQVR